MICFSARNVECAAPVKNCGARQASVCRGDAAANHPGSRIIGQVAESLFAGEGCEMFCPPCKIHAVCCNGQVDGKDPRSCIKDLTQVSRFDFRISLYSEITISASLLYQPYSYMFVLS